MATIPSALVGIIGGSGVYKIDGIEDTQKHIISTPYGFPSDAITIGKVHGVSCAFLPRHGSNHSYTPSEVNYRANIYALKYLGVKYLISVTACGSLAKEYVPGELMLVDQLIDKTYLRKATFFGDGVVGHVPFGHPTCSKFRAVAEKAIKEVLPEVKLHTRGTYVNMEGPAFSTRAESIMHQRWGGDIIGMTVATESKLAREAEMAHCIVAMVTDYDAWSEEEGEHVDVAKVVAVVKQNAGYAQKFVGGIVKSLAKEQFESEAHSACGVAIMTAKDTIPEETKRNFHVLFGKYLAPAE